MERPASPPHPRPIVVINLASLSSIVRSPTFFSWSSLDDDAPSSLGSPLALVGDDRLSSLSSLELNLLCMVLDIVVVDCNVVVDALESVIVCMVSICFGEFEGDGDDDIS